MLQKHRFTFGINQIHLFYYILSIPFNSFYSIVFYCHSHLLPGAIALLALVQMGQIASHCVLIFKQCGSVTLKEILDCASAGGVVGGGDDDDDGGVEG